MDNVYVNITHNLTITADSYLGVYIFENYTDRLAQINTNNPTINIYLGDTIKIINNAFNSHPLLIKETESNILQTNSDNFIEWTPTYIGDYEYYCGNHANMKGIIKVIHSDNFTNPLLTTEINKTFTYNIDNINNYSFTFLNSSDRNGVIYSTNNPDITIYLGDTITINNNSNESIKIIKDDNIIIQETNNLIQFTPNSIGTYIYNSSINNLNKGYLYVIDNKIKSKEEPHNLTITGSTVDYSLENNKKIIIKYKYIYNESNLFDGTLAQLKSYSKLNFDTFRRHQRITFCIDDKNSIETTVGQLNFFRWIFNNKIISYALDNYDNIYNDMIANNNYNKKIIKKNNNFQEIIKTNSILRFD